MRIEAALLFSYTQFYFPTLVGLDPHGIVMKEAGSVIPVKTLLCCLMPKCSSLLFLAYIPILLP